MEPFIFTPIGYFYTNAVEVPRHYSVSEEEGKIVLDEVYEKAISDILPGDKILVVFIFHKSPPFSPDYLRVTPPHKNKETGLFSTSAPVRPNPIGVSILTVLDVNKNIIYVKHIDMLDGTPILDIKPFK